MKEIIFVTSNKGKVATMQRHIKRHGVDLKIVQQSLDIIEPQADTSVEVAKVKARQAYKILKRPVLVDDSSFHISVLGGFPGPYIKYMIATIGIDGIMSFMRGKPDRNAYFLSSLVYIDELGVEHIFEDAPYYGTITQEIDDYDSEKSWSELHKIFIPSGSDKVLARMTDEDRLRVDNAKELDSYEKFCLWAKNELIK